MNTPFKYLEIDELKRLFEVAEQMQSKLDSERSSDASPQRQQELNEIDRFFSNPELIKCLESMQKNPKDKNKEAQELLKRI